MELPFIALVITITVACAIGYARRGPRTLDKDDAAALSAVRDEYLRAVTAAGLVKLSNLVGQAPAEEDIDEAAKGPRLIVRMKSLLEGQKPDVVLRGLDEGNDQTVESFLAGLEADTDKYWPEHAPGKHRVREPQS
jgi:hypothetical protein